MTAPPQPTPPSGAPANQHDIDVRGNKNVVVTGTVGRDLKVFIGERDVREQELAYLNWVVRTYEDWAIKYTPLAGIAEVRAAAMNGPRLDLPMHFMPAGFEKLVERGYGELRQTERVPVDDLRTAVARYKRLVLLGEPGSGKTTTLRRLAYEYAEAALGDARAPLPIYVPLGEYAGPEPALTHVQTAFGALASDLPAYLGSGRVVLLLDGLNEMPQAGYAERVGRIQKLLDLYPDCSVVVTCRALDYVETLRLETMEIKPLDPERQRAYLHRYLGEEDGEKLFWQLCGEEIAALWRIWQRGGGTWERFWTGTDIPRRVYWRISKYQRDLWKTLRGDGLPPLLALGRNPYMLVMLAQVYAAKEGVLPQNRSDLFAAFVDTLLAREQKHCDPTRWPGADQLRRALAHLAYSMQISGERGTAVNRAWVTARLGEVCEPTQTLYLCASANLLDESGGRIRYVHQLLQEYFVARAMQDRVEGGEDLNHFWPQGWAQPSGWEDTFVMLAGMQPDNTPLVKRLLDVNPGLAARCIAQSGGEQPSDDTITSVQQRLVALATSKGVPVTQRNQAGNALNHVGDPRPGVGLRQNSLPDIAWCVVPAGEFIMGSVSNRKAFYGKETPQHRYKLAAFEISKYPITNTQYDAFVQDGGYTAKWNQCWTQAGWQWKGERSGPDRHGGVLDLPNHPVVMVTWYEAVAFCNWLSQKLERAVALPSEAQWERAARHTDGRRYPRGDKLTPDHANYNDTGIDTTSAVGIFPKGASKCGALDMSGNVWEWCQTKWREDYSTLSDEDPTGDAWRVVRGGSFYSLTRHVRCAVRSRLNPNGRDWHNGFRVVNASP